MNQMILILSVIVSFSMATKFDSETITQILLENNYLDDLDNE